MSYYINKITTEKDFLNVVERLKAEMKKEGFGVVTEMDMKKTMKEKLNRDFREYRILGFCNPEFAYKALSEEDKIGVFLPCNVVVQQLPQGEIEIAAIDPAISLSAVGNPSLGEMAAEIQRRIQRVINEY